MVTGSNDSASSAKCLSDCGVGVVCRDKASWIISLHYARIAVRVLSVGAC